MRNYHRTQSGFSLVELMVGIVIALLGSLVIVQVFALTEQSKQTTTSGSDAQQSGALAMMQLDRDMRQAGYGMNITSCVNNCSTPAFMGSSINLTDTGTRVVAATPFTFAPVVINQGVSNAPDSIVVTYGNAANIMVPEYTRYVMAAGSLDIGIANEYIYGYTQGDVLVIANPTTGTGEVIQFSGQDGTNQRIKHDSGSYQQGPNTQNYRYNSGQVAEYPQQSLLFNLGQAPVNNIYSIVRDSSGRSNLVQTSNINGSQRIIATDIVDLQAEYGLDTDGDDKIDSWSTVTPSGSGVAATEAAWKQVLAMRYGLVARSIKREPSCNVTTVVPVWRPDGTTTKSFSNIATNGDWRCYRYRVFETTNVLRNFVWKPD